MHLPRRLALAFALVAAGLGLAALPGRAELAAGTAGGTLTVNGKKIALHHAYARKVKGAVPAESEGFEMRDPEPGETAAEGTYLVLTDVPLPVTDLAYVSAVESALSGGKVQGISWLVGPTKQPGKQDIYHSALKGQVAGNCDHFEITRLDSRIAGKAAEEDDFFDNAWTFDLTFDAPVAALPSRAMQPGTIAGTLTADGKSYTLTHVYARSEPGTFDPKKKQFVVDVVDAEVPPGALKDRFGMMDLARAGKVHGLSVTIDADRRVISGSFYLPGLEAASSTGWQQFEAVVFDAHAIEGRLYTKEPEEIFDHTLTLDARFDVSLP
jgi:hypothetical protein